ncbi:MAG: PAS domain S-box protein [Gammaproteobacteria bacterium]|nr:PAS domain S-box protein [Gammaproteobacteria bacterium]NND53695.1 PAS domain S-box protein [Gammaproteobacteria bacterium]
MTETPDTPQGSSDDVQLDPVLDAMIESLIVIDADGVIERVNKATTDMFGYSPGELLGQNISLLMYGTDKARHDKYLDRYHRTGKKRIIGIGREVLAARKDGSTFPADIAVGEIKRGEFIRYVGLIRDLTEQRQTEEVALKQREEMINVSRLSMMGEMAAAMAHELNQPLTAIANFAAASDRLLQNTTDGNVARVQEALRDIQDQAHRAGEVIRRTRSFTRSGDAERVVTTVNQMYHPIVPLTELDAKASNIRLVSEIPADLPEVSADPVQIQQVMLNLIRNAVDAMQNTAPDRRQILISAKLTAPHEIRVEVRDHGSGVSASDAADIFNAFYTTKSAGMGMGLAICRTIIRNHGGELGFRNNTPNAPQDGATFFFTLPTRTD